MKGDATALIGIDWGTSRHRAYRIDREGRVIESRSGDLGLSAVRGKDFDAALQSLVSDLREDEGHEIPILMCGMIGSRNGWAEAGYCDCPFGVKELARTIVSVTSLGGKAHIVGGGHTTDRHSHHDVMRGEETQFLGLGDTKGPHLAISPGTHSKWALLKNGAIRDFRTYMTGELFALLKDNSILGWLIPEKGKAEDENAFAEGVKDAGADPDMLHALFNVRTSALFQPERAKGVASYLSGLLVGYEVTGAIKAFGASRVTVIAAPHLGRLYRHALAIVGVGDVCLEDADVVTAKGLWRVWQARKDAS